MNPYCEKHEYSAGMPVPCPDCAEVNALKLQVGQLQKDKEDLIEQRDKAYERYDRAFDEAQRSNRLLDEAKKWHGAEMRNRLELQERIDAALNELGVPQPGYPAPVANAVKILTFGVKR